MRVDLNCSATNCVNNQAGLCSANTISIKGKKAKTAEQTKCETFKEGSIYNSLASMGNLNVGGTIKQVFNTDEIEMTPNVHCDVDNCVYNIKNLCTAPGLVIKGNESTNSKETYCQTFIKEKQDK